MRRSQWRWNEVDQCADSKRDLKSDKVNQSPHTLPCVFGQQCPHSRIVSCVSPQGKDGSESGRGKDSVVKLNQRWILKHVTPPEVRVVRNVTVESVEQFLLRRGKTQTHVWELVVDQTGVQTGNERARHGSNEDKDGECSDTTTEEFESRLSVVSQEFLRFGWAGQQTILAEDGKAVPNHGQIADKGGTKVGSKSILTDTRVATRREKVVLQSTLDHPPANKALEADESTDADKLDSHGCRDSAASDKIYGRHKETQTNDTAPKPVNPFHPVDLFELFNRHA